MLTLFISKNKILKNINRLKKESVKSLQNISSIDLPGIQFLSNYDIMVPEYKKFLIYKVENYLNAGFLRLNESYSLILFSKSKLINEELNLNNCDELLKSINDKKEQILIFFRPELFELLIKTADFINFVDEQKIKVLVNQKNYFCEQILEKYKGLLDFKGNLKKKLLKIENFFLELNQNIKMLDELLRYFSATFKKIMDESDKCSENLTQQDFDVIRQSIIPSDEINVLLNKKIDLLKKTYKKNHIEDKIRYLEQRFKNLQQELDRGTYEKHIKEQILKHIDNDDQKKLYSLFINLKNSNKKHYFPQTVFDFYDKDVFGYAGVFPLPQKNGTWADGPVSHFKWSRALHPQKYALMLKDIYQNGYRPSNRKLTYQLIDYESYPNIFFYHDYHYEYGGIFCLIRLNLKGKCIISGGTEGYSTKGNFESFILTKKPIQKENMLIILNDLSDKKEYYETIYLVDDLGIVTGSMYLGDYIRELEKNLIQMNVRFVKEKINNNMGQKV